MRALGVNREEVLSTEEANMKYSRSYNSQLNTFTTNLNSE